MAKKEIDFIVSKSSDKEVPEKIEETEEIPKPKPKGNKFWHSPEWIKLKQKLEERSNIKKEDEGKILSRVEFLKTVGHASYSEPAYQKYLSTKK